MYMIICEIEAQCKSMHEARHSKRMLWDNAEGWGGEGGSGLGDTYIPVADSCLFKAKTTILYVNKLTLKKVKEFLTNK